ncbi:MAG: GNVR domain-containing protein, partial [Bacteroidales bacterium]|nr:GNVR domain-containing protein [Bacteroidales bacterium]
MREQTQGSPLSSSGGISAEALEGFGITGSSYNLYNQQEIIRSWPIIRRTLEALQFEVSYYMEGNIQTRELYTDAPFEVIWPNGRPQLTGIDFHLTIETDGSLRLQVEGEDVGVHDYTTGNDIKRIDKVTIDTLCRAGEFIKGPHYAFTIILRPGFRPGEGSGYLFRFNTIGQLMKKYSGNLTVEITEKYSSILSLSLHDTHTGKGIDFLNKLMEVYMQDNLDQKNDYANRTIAFISSQLGSISDSLSESEQEMLDFRAENKVVNLTAQSEILLTRLTELDNRLAQLESQNKYYRYLRDYIRDNRELETIMAPSAMGVDDPLLSTLIEELNSLILEKARLGQVKSSPRLSQLNAQIDKLKNAMLNNINDIISQGDIRLADLQDRIREAEATVGSLPATERDYVNIERRYQLNNETYTFLLQKLSEAQIARASNVPDSRVVEGATGSGMIAPRKQRTSMIALMLGFIIPALLIILRDYFSTKIYSQDEVEALTSLPILGHVYYNHDKEYHNTPVLDKPNNMASEPYRGLRNKMNLMTRGME